MFVPPFTPSTPLDPQDATVILKRTDLRQRSNLARHLRADGFNVLEVDEGIELAAWCKAFRTAESKLPDVVISDDLISVQQLEDGAKPPFILVTRPDDWRSFMAAERAGAAYVFESSPDDSALRSAVFSLTRAW